MNLYELTGHKPDHRCFVPSDRLVLPSCRVGVEIELENFKKAIVLSPYWEITEDGSLRDGGREMLFADPLFGQDIINALEEVEEYCRNLEPQPEASKRTSVHVHLDVRDMTGEQLINLLLLYFVFEKPLLHYHDNKRDDNIFCLPYHKAESVVEELAEVIYFIRKGEKTRVRSALGNIGKYSAMNVAAVRAKGSVEFRHMGGTYNSEAILEWINIIQSLKQAAITMKGDPLAIPDQMSIQGPPGFLYSVFGETLGEKLLYDNITNDMFSGVRLGQDALYADSLWDSHNIFTKRDGELSELCLSKAADKELANKLAKENF